MSGNQCHVSYGAAWISLRFRLDDEAAFFEALENLKSALPRSVRRWEPALKTWLIRGEWDRTVAGWIAHHFDPAETFVERPAGPWRSAPPPPRPEAPRAGDPYQTLHLLPSAPPAVVTAAYRALAQLHHPDKGGDTAAMQAINAAVEVIRAAQERTPA